MINKKENLYFSKYIAIQHIRGGINYHITTEWIFNTLKAC